MTDLESLFFYQIFSFKTLNLTCAVFQLFGKNWKIKPFHIKITKLSSIDIIFFHPNTFTLNTKGQLISKGLFTLLEFFQKNERNNSIIVLLLGKKTNSFVHFLEESSAWKKHYDWPLELSTKLCMTTIKVFLSMQ